MRCFIAIDISSQILRRIGRLQDELVSLFGDERGVKWVDPSLIHLTLKFLGDVSDDRIADVCAIASQVAQRNPEFNFEVKKVGSFGRPPRVIWVGADSCQALADLAGDLNLSLADAGWARDEKKITGHLTLCRIKNFRAGRRLGRLIADFKDFSAGTLKVDSICVYKSDLTKTGPVYTLLSKHGLTGGR